MNSLTEKIPRLAREFCERRAFPHPAIIEEAMVIAAVAAVEADLETLRETAQQIRQDRQRIERRPAG